MEAIVWLLAGHFLGDFPFQGEWMASQKGKSWEINGYHSLVYTSTVFVIAAMGKVGLPYWAVAIVLLSHFFIDPLKARWGLIKNIWVDQIFHILVLVLVAIAI